MKEALLALKNGGVVVYPTDTVYGLGVDARNLKAVRHLYRLKKRSIKKPIHVIVGSLKQAKQVARFDKRAETIFKKLLPGPVTLVLPLKARGKSWKILSGARGKIGIRMPDKKIALDLVKKFGAPITTTSANISDKKTTYSIEEVEKQFEKRLLRPDIAIDVGELPVVKPSTVIDLTGENAKILRKGPVSLYSILDVIRE